MSRILVLHLLGSPEIELDHAPVTGFMSQKVQAILIYLAMVGQTQSRVKLAALFWPDEPESKARKNVRDVAQNLRKLLPDHIEVTRSTMGMMPDSSWQVDALELETAVTNFPIDPEQLAAATADYRGDFLDGFAIKDASEFDTWVVSQTVRLRELQLHGLQWLSEYALNRRDIQAGLRLTRQSLTLEPWQEQVYKQRMLLYAYGQQPEMALHAYGECKQMLAEAFGTKPRMETQALYQRILAETGELETATPLHNLPRQLTTFFGRAEDAHIVREKVLDDRYPLITVTGEGGIGKTRLALTVAEQSVYDFEDGVWFVPLAGIRTSLEQAEAEDAVATAVATALGLNLSATQPVKAQVMAHIKPLSLLLFFDNFEHLLNARGFIYTLLQEAKKVQFLITSRARLRFQSEFVYRLSGLPVPAKEAPVAQMPNFAGIALFIERAKRSAPFAFADDNAVCIQKICALVDGLPLGIELAAALVEEHSCLEISQKMQPDELETSFFDVPARHRSIQALFDYSWQLLPEDVQRVLAQCSQFAGGFTAEAAQVVMSTTARTLDLLVYQSLLKEGENASTEPGRSGRYDIHPLVQQFAHKKWKELAERETAVARVVGRHAQYYLQTCFVDYAQIWHTPLLLLQAESNNKRQAWANAIQSHDFALLAGTARSWTAYWGRLSVFQEVIKTLKEALQVGENEMSSTSRHAEWKAALQIELAATLITVGGFQEAYELTESVLRLTEEPSILGQAYRWQSVIKYSTGSRDEAEMLMEQAVAFKDVVSALDYIGMLRNKAALLGFQGKKDASRTLLEEALVLAEQHHYIQEKMSVLNNLGVAYQYDRQPYKAILYYQQACEAADSVNYLSGKRYMLNNLILTYIQLGLFQEASVSLDESFALSEGSSDKRRLTELIICQASLYSAMQRYDDAIESGQLAIESFDKSDTYLMMVVFAYRSLGDALLGKKEWERAEEMYQELVVHCESLSSPEGMVEALSGLAFIAYQQGDTVHMDKRVEQLFATLSIIVETHEVIGNMMDVYWRLYVVLDHLDDERAAGVLQTAVSQLNTQANQIPDLQIRKQFLENIQSHRELMNWG